jgi:phage gpG-like protein
MKKHSEEFDKLLKDLQDLKPRLMDEAAVMAVNFFKASFRNEGFTDNSLTPWPKRIAGTPNSMGRGLLMNRGILRRAVKKKSSDSSKTVIGVDGVKYADIQNFGGQIPITRKMRRYFWAMYYQYAKAITKTAKGEVSKSKKNESLNETATFWRNLALTKKQYITIPKRQFIGDSKTLEKNIETLFNQQLNKIFNP